MTGVQTCALPICFPVTILHTWELEQPGRINNIFRAITNVEPSHLADTDLYDFKNLSRAKPEDEDPLFGDIDEKEKSEGALTLANSEGTKIEFIRNL